VHPSTPEEFRAFVQVELGENAQLVQAAGLKPE